MITKVNVANLSHEDWLKERANDIGGSETGAIVGLNPFESAYSLWCKRTGRMEAFTGNLATEVGTALEAFVADKFAAVSGYGKRVQKTKYLYRNSDHPHLHALPDRLIKVSSGGNAKITAGLECKTTSAFNTKAFKGVDFPMQYYTQCVAYMMILEIPVWYLAVLVGNHEFHIYKLMTAGAPEEEDDRYLDGVLTVDHDEFIALQEAVNEFWGFIEQDINPPVDGSESTSEAIDSIYRESTDRSVSLPFLDVTIDMIIDLKEQKKKIDEEIEAHENLIKQQMQDAEKASVGKYLVTWKRTQTSRFDSKSFKADHPDLYDQYSKMSETRTFRIK